MKTADWRFTPATNKPTTVVTWDLETFLIAPLVQAPPVVAMGFSVDGGPVQIVAANTPAFDRVVEALFTDPNVLMVGHNVRFDIIALLAHGARWGLTEWPAMLFGALQANRVTCTLLREKLLHIAAANPKHAGRRFDLGTSCALRETPTQPDKGDEWRLKWGELAGLPVSEYPADATKYLVEDVRACGELYRVQARRPAWLVDEFRQCRASVALGLMSAWGLATDPDVVELVYQDTVADLALAVETCKAHGLIRESGSRDTKAAAARLAAAFEAQGLQVPRKKPTEQMATFGKPGNVQLDEDACLRSKDPVLKAYTKATQATSLLSKVTRLQHPVIQPHFDPLMETGRTSCSQGKDPAPGTAPLAYGSQVQNPPRSITRTCTYCRGDGCLACEGKGEIEAEYGIRECFVARPGTVILDADYNMAELFALSQVERWWFGTSTLGDVLADPKRDVHVEIGGYAKGLAPEAAYALKRTDPKAFKEMRQLGKAISFGAPGGLGAKRFAEFAAGTYNVFITEEQAKEILAMVKKIYVERAAYLKRIGDWSANGAYRFTMPYSGRVRGGLNFTNGANTPFQGLAADAAKEGMWRVAVHCYVLTDSALYGSRPVNFVHDQILVETPEDRYVEAAKELEAQWVGGGCAVMSESPMRSEVAAWRRWSKKAGDAVYHTDSTLAVYEDFVAGK